MKKTIKTESPVEYVVWTALVVLVVVGIYAFRNLIFNSNLDEVIPGKVYRSAQMTPHKLRETIRSLRLKTVINLRGGKDEDSASSWYLDEKKVCDEEGVRLLDIRFSTDTAPTVSALRRLIEALCDADNEPVLIHCRAGADRTGMGAAFAKIVHGGSVEEAEEEFSIWHAHAGIGAGRHMRFAFEYYKDWLEENGAAPGPESLKKWRHDSYYPYRKWIDEKGLPGGPDSLGKWREETHRPNDGPG